MAAFAVLCLAPSQLPAPHAPPWGDCGLCPGTRGRSERLPVHAFGPSPRPALARASAADAPPASLLWRAGSALCCRHRACGVLSLLGRLPTCHPRSRPGGRKICRRRGLKLLPLSRRPNRLRPTFAGKVMVCRTGAPTQVEAQASVEREFGEPSRGWQRLAAAAGDERALELHLSHLDAASRALLLSQAGPHVARSLTVLPTSRSSRSPRRSSGLSCYDA